MLGNYLEILTDYIGLPLLTICGLIAVVLLILLVLKRG